MIRSTERHRLAVLLRYEELLASDSSPCDGVLRAIVAARTPLLEDLAEADLARGDLPPGGDREITERSALPDSLLARLLGAGAVQQRLLCTGRRCWPMTTISTGGSPGAPVRRRAVPRPRPA